MNINENNIGNYSVPSELQGGIAVDIGANVGLFSINNSSFFSKIHTYEPITVLSEKIKNHNIPNVSVFNEAVGSYIGTAKMILHKNQDSGSTTTNHCLDEVISVHKEWSDTVICEVPMVDLKTVLNRIGGNIDYLKMDCEVSEYFILMNKDLSKIKYIGIEIHGQMGEQKWNELKSWVSNTHTGFPSYSERNSECLLVLR